LFQRTTGFVSQQFTLQVKLTALKVEPADGCLSHLGKKPGNVPEYDGLGQGNACPVVIHEIQQSVR
jgi:hypothetical protein